MTEPAPHNGPRPWRLLRRSSALLLLTAGALGVLLQLYLVSPFATTHVSALLTRNLQRTVQLDGLRLTLTGIELRGLRIANAPDLAAPWLLQAATIRVGAHWQAWLQGQRTVPSIAVSAPRLQLARQANGQWNLQELLRPLQRNKPGAEMVIGRLTISDGSILYPGGELRALQLAVTDLATRGAKPLHLTLSAQDQAGATVRATGTARLGARPSADVSLQLAAPLARYNRPAAPLSLDHAQATGELQLTLAAGEFTFAGTIAVSGAAWRSATGQRQLPAQVRVRGTYQLAGDSLRLAEARLELAKLAAITATATITEVKHSRRFTADLAMGPVALTALQALLPRPLGVELSGELALDQLHLGGDRTGLQTATGRSTLRDGSISRHGVAMLQRVTAATHLVTTRDGWHLTGIVSQPAQQQPLVQRLSLPFQAAFSRQFALCRAATQPSVTLGTAPLTGALAYQPGASPALTGQLRVTALPLNILAPLLKERGIEPTAGTGSAELTLNGSMAELTGALKVQAQGMAAKVQGKPASLAQLTATATIRHGQRVPLTVNATLHGDGGLWRGTPFSLATGLDYGDRRLQLRGVTASFGEQRLAASVIDYPLQTATVVAGVRQLPLQFSASSVTLTGSGGMAMTNAQLHTQLFLQQIAKRRWLTGTAQLQAEGWQLRHQHQGGFQAIAQCHPGETVIQLHGGVLGGELTGEVRLDPFALNNGVAFNTELTKAVATHLAPFLPKGNSRLFTDGTLAATAAGRYQTGRGLNGKFALHAAELGLALSTGTSALTGVGCQMAGTVTPELLHLPILQLTFGPTLQLTAAGDLYQPFLPERSGAFTLAPHSAPISAWLDAGANLLPRALQEATAGGTVALSASLRLASGKTLLDGGITFQEGSLVIPSQKLHLAGVTGTLPLSLASGGSDTPLTPKARRERGDYPALLAELQRTTRTGEQLGIASIAFGPLQLGPTTIFSRASNGLLEFTHLESALFNAQLVGRGSVHLGGKLRYEADLLVSDLSLRLLCTAFPAINGYLSGRVDGMLALLGDGPGLANLVGSTELWTRSVPEEQRLISKEFLQKLAGKKLKGYFFRDDRPFDRGEIKALLQNGYLTFDTLDISHSTLGFRDLSVSVAAVQNRIAIDHLLGAVRAAAERGKAAAGQGANEPPPLETEFKWAE